jgi:hypothetical protein
LAVHVKRCRLGSSHSSKITKKLGISNNERST